MWVVGGWWVVVCRQTLRQVVAQLELELLRPCQYLAEKCTVFIDKVDLDLDYS